MDHDNDKARECLQQYCPFENLGRQHGTQKQNNVLSHQKIQDYPPMFLVGTCDDENVSFWHAVTYGKKLLDMMTLSSASSSSSDNEKTKDKLEKNVLIHVEETGGHHLHGRQLYVSSLEIAFLLGLFPRVRDTPKQTTTTTITTPKDGGKGGK
eukprot:1485328-Ditylum_brightwellii.AAC.1